MSEIRRVPQSNGSAPRQALPVRFQAIFAFFTMHSYPAEAFPGDAPIVRTAETLYHPDRRRGSEHTRAPCSGHVGGLEHDPLDPASAAPNRAARLLGANNRPRSDG